MKEIITVPIKKSQFKEDLKYLSRKDRLFFTALFLFVGLFYGRMTLIFLFETIAHLINLDENKITNQINQLTTNRAFLLFCLSIFITLAIELWTHTKIAIPKSDSPIKKYNLWTQLRKMSRKGRSTLNLLNIFFCLFYGHAVISFFVGIPFWALGIDDTNTPELFRKFIATTEFSYALTAIIASTIIELALEKERKNIALERKQL